MLTMLPWQHAACIKTWTNWWMAMQLRLAPWMQRGHRSKVWLIATFETIRVGRKVLAKDGNGELTLEASWDGFKEKRGQWIRGTKTKLRGQHCPSCPLRVWCFGLWVVCYILHVEAILPKLVILGNHHDGLTNLNMMNSVLLLIYIWENPRGVAVTVIDFYRLMIQVCEIRQLN